MIRPGDLFVTKSGILRFEITKDSEYFNISRFVKQQKTHKILLNINPNQDKKYKMIIETLSTNNRVEIMMSLKSSQFWLNKFRTWEKSPVNNYRFEAGNTIEFNLTLGPDTITKELILKKSRRKLDCYGCYFLNREDITCKVGGFNLDIIKKCCHEGNNFIFVDPQANRFK